MTTWKADITSEDMMRKVRALTEQEISKMGLNQVAIFRPPFIANTFGKYFHGMVAINSMWTTCNPLTNSMGAELLARSMLHHAAESLEGKVKTDPVTILDPTKIIKFIRDYDVKTYNFGKPNMAKSPCANREKAVKLEL